MKLQARYEFSELKKQDGVLLAEGSSRESGKRVQIFLFPSTKAEQARQLKQTVFSLPEDARDMVLEFGDGEGGPFFVTEPLPEGESLVHWIQRLSAENSGLPPSVNSEITAQLRQMPVYPAPLAPVLPGPEFAKPSASPNKEPTQDAAPKVTPMPVTVRQPEPTPATTGTSPGSSSTYFNRLYGAGDKPKSQPAVANLPPPPTFTAPPLVPTALENKNLSLASFIGVSGKSKSPMSTPQVSQVRQPEIALHYQSDPIEFDKSNDTPIFREFEPAPVRQEHYQPEPSLRGENAPVRSAKPSEAKRPWVSKTLIMYTLVVFIFVLAMIACVVELLD